MRVLVTGVAGMIAAHVAQALLRRGDRVVGADNLSRGHRERVPDGTIFVQVDVADAVATKRLFAEHGPFDAVIHEASIINAGIDLEDVAQDVTVNVNGTANLLTHALRHGVKRFVYASSVAIYGRPEALPATEAGTMPEPIASYGISKLAAEHYVRYFCDKSAAMTGCSLRYCNIYGPGQLPFGEVGVMGVFVERLAKGETLTIHGDGTQCRDFLYVGDCVEATLAALDSDSEGVFNIGSGHPTTVNEIVDALEAVLGKRPAVAHSPARHGEIGRFWSDIAATRKALGWTPKTGLVDGLRKTVDWRLHGAPLHG